MALICFSLMIRVHILYVFAGEIVSNGQADGGGRCGLRSRLGYPGLLGQRKEFVFAIYSKHSFP